jgi:hypothetical protein
MKLASRPEQSRQSHQHPKSLRQPVHDWNPSPERLLRRCDTLSKKRSRDLTSVTFLMWTVTKVWPSDLRCWNLGWGSITKALGKRMVCGFSQCQGRRRRRFSMWSTLRLTHRQLRHIGGSRTQPLNGCSASHQMPRRYQCTQLSQAYHLTTPIHVQNPSRTKSGSNRTFRLLRYQARTKNSPNFSCISKNQSSSSDERGKVRRSMTIESLKRVVILSQWFWTLIQIQERRRLISLGLIVSWVRFV